MTKIFENREIQRYFMIVIGSFLFAAGLNLFIVPAGLYMGGMMGMAQLIRTGLNHLSPRIAAIQFDIAGLLYYLANIPIFVMGYRKLGKRVLIDTFVAVTVMTVFLSIIPVTDLLGKDELTCCLVGAVFTGYGTGLLLRNGSSSGGMDIVGLMLMKKNRKFSVGKINVAMDTLLYCICFFVFDVSVVIYSLVYAAMFAIIMDRAHYQNIDVCAHIVTGNYSKEMEDEILINLDRGVTKWNGTGAYTADGKEILLIVLSKYEIAKLKEIVYKYDENAFIVLDEKVNILGNYVKKL